MLLQELLNKTSDVSIREGSKVAWAKQGSSVVRKFRCTDGKRKGRIVSSPADCNKPIDLKKRIKFNLTKKARGGRIKARSARTKRRNPASLRVQRLNKAMAG